jgi:AraC-like DNA-binding protein
MRQLERARDRIEAGMPAAEAALDAGFSDQSHMT